MSVSRKWKKLQERKWLSKLQTGDHGNTSWPIYHCSGIPFVDNAELIGNNLSITNDCVLSKTFLKVLSEKDEVFTAHADAESDIGVWWNLLECMHQNHLNQQCCWTVKRLLTKFDKTASDLNDDSHM